jgi:hypothetical protein
VKEFISEEILSKNGLLNAYVLELKKNGASNKEAHRFEISVRRFLKSVVRGRTKNLNERDFARLIGFTELNSEDKKQEGRKRFREIYWRSSEEVREDSELGLLNLNMSLLEYANVRKIMSYFIKTVYAPYHEKQDEILHWMINLKKEQDLEHNTIKIGVLHSLSGTMAISETSLWMQ